MSTPPGGGRPATRAVHAGERQTLPRRPATTPVVLTAPWVFTDLDELERAFSAPDLAGTYGRYGNPTVRAAEEKLAALEGAEEAVAFASGMAAISALLLALLRSGDRLLATAELYGGTRGWLDLQHERQPEIALEVVPGPDLLERLAAAPAPRLVLVETPANPRLECLALARLAAACAACGALLVVDSTFATPVLQNPLALGAGLVVHSATKFLAGHSDTLGGFVAGSAAALAPVRRVQRTAGAVLDPHAAFLVSRGMKTLFLRVERQSASAARLAALLGEHPAVAAVHYPGHDPVGRSQMRAGGGMLSFDLAGGAPAVARLVAALEVFQILPSLGGVESGLSIPARTSHRHLAAAERAALGIGDGLVRLSVGIEDPDDLEDDLRRGLQAAR